MKQSNSEIIINNEFKMARDYFSNLVYPRGNTKPTIASCYVFATVALEKQVPKKPIYYGLWHKCPACRKVFIFKPKYCKKCGQALGWNYMTTKQLTKIKLKIFDKIKKEQNREEKNNVAIMTKPNNLAFRVDEKNKDIFLHQSVSKSRIKQMKKSANQIEKQLKRGR